MDLFNIGGKRRAKARNQATACHAHGGGRPPPPLFTQFWQSTSSVSGSPRSPIGSQSSPLFPRDSSGKRRFTDRKRRQDSYLFVGKEVHSSSFSIHTSRSSTEVWPLEYQRPPDEEIERLFGETAVRKGTHKDWEMPHRPLICPVGLRPDLI